MSKELTIEKATLSGFEIIYDRNISYGKDKYNTSVTIELNINDKVFKHTAYMRQWQVSVYLKDFGAEV